MAEKLVRLISRAEIAATVTQLAQKLDRDYEDRYPILVGILNGSFIFLADLVRNMKTPIANIEFIRLSSYGSSTITSGQAEVVWSLPESAVMGRQLVLIEDIVDTGITTDTALRYLRQYRPASLKLCSLLDKPDRRKVGVKIDYLGLTVPDRFIVGYGIDFAQKYRQLRDIYVLEE